MTKLIVTQENLSALMETVPAAAAWLCLGKAICIPRIRLAGHLKQALIQPQAEGAGLQTASDSWGHGQKCSICLAWER